jgi:sigma-B regulation protein RsbU (phosphoserine phosphatase)
MKSADLNKFRETISHHHQALLEWLATDDAESRSFPFGGTDLQGVLQVVSELKGTLEEIDKGQFGKCKVCQGEVEIECLEMDCTSDICLEHFSEHQKRQLERDLELAVKVYEQLLPCCVPALDELDTAFYHRPAQMIGGDYFDFFSDNFDNQGFVIADVMGKGLPASMLMANLQASLRILGPTYTKPEQLTDHLNRLFRFNMKLISFISLFLVIVDHKNYQLRYTNAGHHPPLLYRSKSNSVSWLKPTGPALGLVKDAFYSAKSLTFNRGDCLLLYTDGLVEARGKTGEEFGEQRLKKFIKGNHNQSADQLVNYIRQQVELFADEIIDDLTLLIIKRC